MSCYHPLRAAIIPGKSVNGKRNIKFFGVASTDNTYCYQDRSHPDTYHCSPNDVETAYWRKLDTMLLPCGQCIGCRLDYSRRWATRLMLELPYHTNNYFVTLTYNNDNLPIGTGVLPTLVPDDLQKFIKRLRKAQSQYTDTKLRFYACGEYGTKSNRPHYHLIIYDLVLPDDDLIFLKYSQHGNPYYTSKLISKCWTFGYNLVAGVSWQSCAYVARYMLKKQKGDGASVYQEHGIEPEFVRMSRNPGIAKQYYDDHAMDMLRDRYVQLSDGLKAPIPRYFDPFYEVDYPDEYAKMADDRVLTAQMLSVIKDYSTELDYFEQLLIDEDVKERASRKLLRSLD